MKTENCNKTQLRKKCDRLWFEVLLEPTCEVCGKKAQQVHHFIPKGRCSATRYSLNNGISLCYGCHYSLHSGDPRITTAIIDYRGQGWYEELQEETKQQVKTDLAYYRKKYAELEKLSTKK